jgi:glutamyl-Q tRNA(Asp) synthetase
MPGSYIGRFAPSPTGSLHLGSLLAAVASYLDARAQAGQWRVRIEDIDNPRVIPGSADDILRTLDAFGLHWDGAVEYQSHRIAHYQHALESLRSQGLVFECSCSRRELAGQEESGYSGICRKGPKRPGPTATRFRIDDSKHLTFQDRIQGTCDFDLKALGDVVIRRRDGLFAYQLAVVIDDAAQGITDIVRGADLLTSTAWQMEIRSALNLPDIHHAHLPLVVEPNGTKLAKSKRSVPVDPAAAGDLLFLVLQLLRQNPPAELRGRSADALAWGITHWNPALLHAVQEVRLPL